MRDDHPAEKYRAVMAELDAEPPAEPSPPPPAPPPRPVVIVAPPERVSLWAITRQLLVPALCVLLALALVLVPFLTR